MAWSIIPRAQTSIFGVVSVYPFRTSGGMYFKDPAFDFSGLLPRVEPNIPKSTSLSSISNSFVNLLPGVLESSSALLISVKGFLVKIIF